MFYAYINVIIVTFPNSSSSSKYNADLCGSFGSFPALLFNFNAMRDTLNSRRIMHVEIAPSKCASPTGIRNFHVHEFYYCHFTSLANKWAFFTVLPQHTHRPCMIIGIGHCAAWGKSLCGCCKHQFSIQWRNLMRVCQRPKRPHKAATYTDH